MTTPGPDVLGSLTVLVQAIRPEWDTRAIRPVLADLLAQRRDLADLTHAAIRTAQDPAMRRPAAIAFDSDHWRPTIRDTETADERAARIQAQVDGRREAEHVRAGLDTPARAAARAQARAALDAACTTAKHTNHKQEQT